MNLKTTMIHRTAFLSCITALLLAGCVNTPRGYVAKEWSSTMRELGIIPVFPPREDVQVGDVYLAPVSPDEEIKAFKKKEFLPLGLWLASLDLRNTISNFYSARSSFPTTPTNVVEFVKQLTNNPYAGLPQAYDPSRNIFLGGDTNRLRMVGFPSFMSATFNKGDLAAVVPVEAVNLAFGAGFSSARSVTVSVPVAESYGIPASLICSKKWLADGRPMDSLNGGLAPAELSHLVNPRQAVLIGSNYFAVLRVINEVYYTRAVDISVATKTTRGLGVAGKPLATDALATAKSAAAAAAAAGAAANNTASNAPVFIMAGVTNFNANAIERAAEMNRSLDQAMAQTVPGGSVKFVAAGDRGVSMRRTYDRPIAIGYRYFPLLVPIDRPLAPNEGWSPTARREVFVSPVTNTNAPTATHQPSPVQPTPGPAPESDPGRDLPPSRPVQPNP
jgi:hypothetical protein